MIGRLAVSAAVLLAATACGTATSLRSTALPEGGRRTLSSADLQKLVVYAKGGTIWRIWIDGRHAKRLASGNDPAISPDGRRIVFHRGPSLFVMGAAGGAAKKVYTAARNYPQLQGATWSPDSRRIAFLTTNGQGGTWLSADSLVVLDAFNLQAHRVTAPSSESPVSTFRFSPNSRKIAYEVEFCCDGRARVLYVASIRGGTPLRLTPDEKRQVPSVQDFGFSPDSRKIVYALQHFNGGLDLFVVPTRGGTPLRVTHDRKSSNPVWGTTGIAFLRADTGRLFSRGDIWLSDGTSHGARKLTRDDAATSPYAFSADGKTLLAFGGGRLWRLDVATGDERPFTPPTLDIFPGELSADGSTVLATIGCGRSHPYIEAIPVNGGRPHVVARGLCDASWNAG